MAEITEREAGQMSREEALRLLATAEEGVSEKDRHTAQLMLTGPVIDEADERRLARGPKRKPMVMAIRAAFEYMTFEEIREEQAARADASQLGGTHG